MIERKILGEQLNSFNLSSQKTIYDICKFQLFKEITISHKILNTRQLYLDCIHHFQARPHRAKFFEEKYLQSWQKPMGTSIKTPPPKFDVVFRSIFVVFKWDFLLSTKYCFLTLIFWDCHSKSFFSYLRYSGIVDSKKFHLKTTKWKFLLLTFPEYQSKKKISNNIESGGAGKGSIT